MDLKSISPKERQYVVKILLTDPLPCEACSMYRSTFYMSYERVRQILVVFGEDENVLNGVVFRDRRNVCLNMILGLLTVNCLS